MIIVIGISTNVKRISNRQTNCVTHQQDDETYEYEQKPIILQIDILHAPSFPKNCRESICFQLKRNESLMIQSYPRQKTNTISVVMTSEYPTFNRTNSVTQINDEGYVFSSARGTIEDAKKLIPTNMMIKNI